jgi:hypothetical protein
MMLFDEFLNGLGDAHFAQNDPVWAKVLHEWSTSFPRDCPKFELRGVDLYDDNVVDFGKQMCASHVLAYPADAFYFQWEHWAVKETETTLDGVSRFVMRNAQPGEKTAMRQTCGLFVYMVLSETSSKAHMVRCSRHDNETAASIPIGLDLYGNRCADLLNGTFATPADEFASSLVVELLAFLSVLTIKQAKQTAIRPSPRAQAKRQKRGEPPLPEYVTIHLTPATVEAASDSAGFRNSPRPHFRRGHIRFINRGTDKERIIPVAPSWVNASGVSAPAIRPYRVRS